MYTREHPRFLDIFPGKTPENPRNLPPKTRSGYGKTLKTHPVFGPGADVDPRIFRKCPKNLTKCPKKWQKCHFRPKAYPTPVNVQNSLFVDTHQHVRWGTFRQFRRPKMSNFLPNPSPGKVWSTPKFLVGPGNFGRPRNFWSVPEIFVGPGNFWGSTNFFRPFWKFL